MFLEALGKLIQQILTEKENLVTPWRVPKLSLGTTDPLIAMGSS